MFVISKQMHFAASHQLVLPSSHKCSRLHGHNYRVEFVMRAKELDWNGMVRDFGDLDIATEAIAKLDHQHLNDLMPCTTAEWVALWLFNYCTEDIPELILVRVYETDTSWAEYRQ